jgi:hypothetical protein
MCEKEREGEVERGGGGGEKGKKRWGSCKGREEVRRG